MNTKIGSIVFTVLSIRRATLFNFCKHFNIEINSQIKQFKQGTLIKDQELKDNFIYFLIENKTFIKLYEQDYYLDKSIEIIANKIAKKETDILNYFAENNFKLNSKYPYRYISSYKVDFDLGSNYNFLKYNDNLRYEGNFQFRRAQIEAENIT